MLIYVIVQYRIAIALMQRDKIRNLKKIKVRALFVKLFSVNTPKLESDRKG